MSCAKEQKSIFDNPENMRSLPEEEITHAEHIEELNSRNGFINCRKLIEIAALVFDEVLVRQWTISTNHMSLVDSVATLAIVVAGYDEKKWKVLRDKVLEINPLPTDSEEDRFLFGLFKLMIYKPRFYLSVIHKEYGDWSVAEIEALATYLQTGKSILSRHINAV